MNEPRLSDHENVESTSAAVATARVVIVNWRQPEITKECVRSILPQLRCHDRLVIVDNASGDQSVEELRFFLEHEAHCGENVHVELRVADSNRGFGSGVNAGANDLSEDVLILLNNDACARPGFRDAVVAPFFSSGASRLGAVTARMLLAGRYRIDKQATAETEGFRDQNGQVWVNDSQGILLINSTGNCVDSHGNGYDRSWLQPAQLEHDSPQVFGICGGACAIRAEAWQEMEGFREDFFMYYEDTELSYRLRRAQWTIEYIRGAEVDHRHAQSMGTQSPLFVRCNVRNRLIVSSLYRSPQQTAYAYLRTVAHLFHGPHRWSVFQGLGDAAQFSFRSFFHWGRSHRDGGTQKVGGAVLWRTRK
ncbi:glycosyltransferase family 2 protein [Actinomyces vulturis]|uniref:glycosyltransferase family 2 protein n=1 Tax=Actinomyces vulturis TaxID=1857645 RepID=UPI000833C02E|nr:glycosyltransferase [Actinomyces vulturis]